MKYVLVNEYARASTPARALLLALVMKRMSGFTVSLTRLIGLEQRPSPRKIYAAALSGVYLHILLDSRLYTDIRPFYPFAFNPFLDGMGVAFEIWWFCVVTGLIGAARARIIGGIADALNNIAYNDDRQIKEVHYSERKKSVDEYWVSVSKI